MPWIHLEDTINMFLYALGNEALQGVYNMAAPFPVTNRELTRGIAKQLHKPLWLPKVPELALRIWLGELSRVVLNSNRTASNKIESTGFKFKFSKLEEALADIYA